MRTITITAEYNNRVVEGETELETTEVEVLGTFPLIKPQGNFTLENIITAEIRDIIVLTKAEYRAREPLDHVLYLITG